MPETTESATSACHFCAAEFERGINANHWTGTEYVRVDVCSEPACRALLASAPRRPRTPRAPRPLYGDYAMLARLNGISTDGSGRRVR